MSGWLAPHTRVCPDWYTRCHGFLLFTPARTCEGNAFSGPSTGRNQNDSGSGVVMNVLTHVGPTCAGNAVMVVCLKALTSFCTPNNSENHLKNHYNP